MSDDRPVPRTRPRPSPDVGADPADLPALHRTATPVPDAAAQDAGEQPESSALEFALGRVVEVVADHEDRLSALENVAAAKAAAQMTLEQYVEHVQRDFNMTEVRADWQVVPSVFAELTALHRAHLSVYQPRSGAFEQIYYLDALERVRARISEHYKRHTKATTRG